jgi:5-oxoprolinase (ATP-hydrolysing) subunit A
LIEDQQESLEQVLQMVMQRTITSVNEKEVPIVADTICVHGDGAHAIQFAREIKAVLLINGVEVKS